MSDPLQVLKELAYLAHEYKSDESRRDLLRRVTDVFLASPGAYTEQQNRYFGEILETIAYDLETQMRESLALRIADEEHIPLNLVHRLAADDISVARPVLEQSPALSQDDLINLSQNSSQEHLLAVTKRSDVGQRLSAVLVRHGKDPVVDSLLRNEDADIAASTMRDVATRAVTSEALQSALIEREDVPRDVLVGLLDYVSDGLKQSLFAQISDTDRACLDDIVTKMKQEVKESDETRAERYITDLVRRGALNEQMLLRFVFEEKPMEFLLTLGHLLGIDQQVVSKLVSENSGQALAIACRACGISAGAFKDMALSPMTSIPSDVRQIMPLIRVYRRLSEANAQRAMRYWKMRNFAGRAAVDRRSGIDTRTPEERARQGERRSGRDRRKDAAFAAMRAAAAAAAEAEQA